MSFLDQWRAQIPPSVSHLLYQFTKDTIVSCELTATATLWPIREQIKDYQAEAIAAIDQIIPECRSKILRLVASWPEAILDAVEVTREAAHDRDVLRALIKIIEVFQADVVFLQQFQIPPSQTVFYGEVKAALINTGTMTISQLHIHLPDNPEAREQERIRQGHELLQKLPTDLIPEPTTELRTGSRTRLQPKHNAYFLGRDPNLLELAKQLKKGEVTVITAGIGGVGKSTLASEFVYRYGHYFAGGVFWLNFADQNGIDGEIAACGGSEGMQLFSESDDLSLEERCARVKAAWSSSIPRLLIFDNWDGLAEWQSKQLLGLYLPQGSGCRVLITSRNSQWPPNLKLHTFVLGVLQPKESIDLLRSYRSDISETDAKAIAEQLGRLPLGLTLAGMFLARYRDLAFGEPQTYFKNLREKMLEHSSLITNYDRMPGHRPINRQELGVYASLHLSYEQLQATDERDRFAIAALARASYFAPNTSISYELIMETLGDYDPKEEDQAQLRADAIKRLLEVGFVEAAEAGGVRMHRLIAEYAQQAINDSEAQAQVEQVVVAHIHYLVNEKRPAQLLPLIPHLRHCYHKHQPTEDLGSGELALALGRAEHEQINYREAERLYQQALKIYQEQLGIKHLATASSLHNLAGLYEAQGRYTEAERLFQLALTIRIEQLGINHPDTASSLNTLAGLYQSQGRYIEAKPLYQQALTIRIEQLGINHPDTANSLNNLATLYQSQGRYDEAEHLYQQALRITQEHLGINHPDTANSLNNLALLYESQGRYDEAEPLFQQALKIRIELLGINHPDTATSLNTLAGLYREQGRYDEAEPLLQQALKITQELLGINHPDTAFSLNNLALLYYAQGCYTEVEPLFQQALDIYQELLGINHPHTATSLNNLAGLYQSQGRYDEAEHLYQQALRITQEHLGINHPDTANSLNNLALLYESQGRYDEAEPLFQQALKIRIELLGINHPDTATSLNNLATLYQSQGRYTEAEPLYLQALKITQEQLGINHPDTASSLNNLAGLYQSQGRYTEAEPLLQQALKITQEHLGINHPYTASSLNNLAGLYQSQGRYDEAEHLYQQAHSILEQVLGAKHPYTKSAHNGLVRCQHLGLQLSNATAAVEQALANPAIDRVGLAQHLERNAQQAEAGEGAGSPWLVFAAQLRELAAKLQSPPAV
jgi:tetratricopeptide (TPR) repeat protein